MTVGDRLLTAADVAERLAIPETQVLRRARAESWPCVRFSKKVIRFTDADVEQIVARHHSTPAEPAAAQIVGLPGQSARSRGRRASP